MEKQKIHWLKAFIGILILAPIFFFIYGWTNSYTASLPSQKIGEIFYSWEKNIPFIPCSIFPYWSIDLLYGLSLFLPMTAFAWRQHYLRLLIATPIACGFFLLFPLTFSWQKPETFGIWKWLFDTLLGFDKPFNQAPSLHIILLVIIWRIYLPHFKKFMKAVWHIWCFLIGISILTTFQHHFIDFYTGFGVGIIICYIFPLNKIHKWEIQTIKSYKIAAFYLIIFVILTLIAFISQSWFSFVLLWVALPLLLVGLAYLGLGSSIFQKKENGKFTFASTCIFFSFILFNKLIRKYFFKEQKQEIYILPNLAVSGFSNSQTSTCKAIFDLCSEYPNSIQNKNYCSFPVLDLSAPTLLELENGLKKLEHLTQENQSVLVHCALGLSRSVTFVLAYLLKNKIAFNIEEAITLVENKNYTIHLSHKHKELLNLWMQKNQ